MEGGLHEASLAQVGFPLAGQQAFPEKLFDPFQTAAFGEVLVLGDQHLADEVGMVDEEDVFPAEPQIDHVAIFPGDLLQLPQGIPAELEEQTPGVGAFGSGRHGGHHSSRLSPHGTAGEW